MYAPAMIVAQAKINELHAEAAAHAWPRRAGAPAAKAAAASRLP